MMTKKTKPTNFIPQKLYNQILKSVPITCVDVAIRFENRVLLVKREDHPAKGEWWVPGGRVHKGEMMADAAIRKAQEEVGLKCYAGPIIHTAETIFPEGPYHIPVHSINSCFFMYPVNSSVEINLDQHHRHYKWVTKLPRGLHPYVEQCLLGAGLKK